MWQGLPEMCSGSTVAYLRLIDSCITQLKAQGPSRTCNESKEEEEEEEVYQKAELHGVVFLLLREPLLPRERVLY